MPLDPKQVAKPARKLRKVIKRVGREPSAADVHDLRTNTRRLEATLTALSLDTKREGKRLLKDIAKIRKRAGKVRDMDVLTAYGASINAKGEQDCRVQLLESLGARRRKLGKKLHGEVAETARSVRKRLKNTARDLDRILCSPPDRECNPAAAAAEATATALRLQSELATAPRHLGRQNLHPYRLKVKELRNVLRMADQETDMQFVDTLGEVKDAIGEWHDWEELVATAQGVLTHGANCQLVREMKNVAREKYEHALVIAENLRRKHLRVSRGPNGRHAQMPASSVSAVIGRMAA